MCMHFVHDQYACVLVHGHGGFTAWVHLSMISPLVLIPLPVHEVHDQDDNDGDQVLHLESANRIGHDVLNGIFGQMWCSILNLQTCVHAKTDAFS